jgi:chemotaxis protein histidine kinase CheA
MGVIYAAGSQIANGMGRTHNAMSKMLQTLERRGVIARDGTFPTGGIRWRIDPDELAEWVEWVKNKKAENALEEIPETGEAQEELSYEEPVSLTGAKAVPETNWNDIIDGLLKGDKNADRILAEEATRFAAEEAKRIADEKAEAARIAEEEARLAEEIRLAEEAERVAEAARVAAAAEAHRVAMEADREARRLAKEAENARIAEGLRLAAEAEKAEKLRIEEEARQALENQKAQIEADAKKFRVETEARLQALVNEYNGMLESGKPWGEYEKAVKEESVRVCATSLGLRPTATDINTEGWLINHLYVWGGESFNFTIRYKLLKLGGVADPMWNALDQGELDYKQAWKVVSRYKRAMKKKGAPTNGDALMLKLMGEVKTLTPDSSPVSQEFFDDAPGSLDCPMVVQVEPPAPEPVSVSTPTAAPKRSLRLGLKPDLTKDKYGLLPPKTIVPDFPPSDGTAIIALNAPMTAKEIEAERQAAAAFVERRAIRREIVLTYAEMGNKSMNNRQLITVVSRNLPRAHHPNIIDERDQMIVEGLIIPALKKGYYILDKSLAFEVHYMLNSKAKALLP